MGYNELMAKLAEGKPLTADEVSELQRETRPATRFNEVCSERDSLKSAITAKDTEIATLKTASADEKIKIQDEVNSQLKILSGKVEDLTKENQNLTSKVGEADFKSKVSEIAKNNASGAEFTDAHYLSVLIKEANLDVTKQPEVDAFMKALKEKKDYLFSVPVVGGTGTHSKTQAGGADSATVPEFSKMTMEAKVAYLKEHGEEAYNKLKQPKS